MAESQPLSAAPEGAEYLRAVLRAPVYEAAQITPLQKMEKLSSRLDNVVLVKREDRQPVHSFKLRGAYAMMAGLTEEQKSHGVITASAGNHAQGVAFSASRLGVKALIVMPTATADIKVDAVRGFGGEVLLHEGGYSVVDLSDDEMAKLHVRYMVGGRPSQPLQERLFSFEFPESPGALLKFLHTLGTHWNISLFHYRSHGTDYGRVLAAFELGDHEPDFETRLHELGYDCHDESNNPAFRFFLAG